MTFPTWTAAFESHARHLLDLYQSPGLAIGLAKAGKPLYFQGFGHRDVAQDLPLTPETVMGIGSCTKSFTCVAIMQLQEAGLLSVHDPVVKFLPEFRTPDPAQTRAITLHHLMTHTAGLPPLPTLLHAIVDSMKADPALNVGTALDAVQPVTTLAELLDRIAVTPFELLGPPGTRFSYSNDGFALLGAVVEQVSGLSFATYLRERILGPAGMTRTGIDRKDLAAMENVAVLYTKRSETEVGAAPIWWELGCMAPAGQMHATVADMLRYCELYRTGGEIDGVRILRPESVRAMMTPYVEWTDGQWYGYGLMITPNYHGVSLVEHGGALKGVSAQFSIVPGRGLTGVALTNMAGVPSANLLLAALNGALDLPLERKRVEPAEYPATPAELERCAGAFAVQEGLPGVMTTWVEDGKLMLKTEGGLEPTPPTALLPTGPGRFQLKQKETTAQIRCHFDGAGQVWAMQVGLRMYQRKAE